jgi:hypothetical protein
MHAASVYPEPGSNSPKKNHNPSAAISGLFDHSHILTGSVPTTLQLSRCRPATDKPSVANAPMMGPGARSVKRAEPVDRSIGPGSIAPGGASPDCIRALRGLSNAGPRAASAASVGSGFVSIRDRCGSHPTAPRPPRQPCFDRMFETVRVPWLADRPSADVRVARRSRENGSAAGAGGQRGRGKRSVTRP